MKFKFCCDKFVGHKSLGIRFDHDEFAIGFDLVWCFIGVARVYPYQSLVMAEDLRKDM
jgi:hypothetical protein